MMWSGGRATDSGPVRLSTAPLRVEDIGGISPMGLMVGGHVTPSDHWGIRPKDRRAPIGRYEVLAPADGYIVAIQHRVKNIGDPGAPKGDPDQYRVIFEHSGTFWTYIDLVDRLDSSVLAAVGGSVPGGPTLQLRHPVKAGHVIGVIGGSHGLDFAVVNTEVTLDGFVVPSHYDPEPWKIHTVDPFDYFDEPLKTKLMALNPRKTPPYGGKIDYDISGRLIGNWFKEGHNGFGSSRNGHPWKAHLAIVPHYIDPSKIVISIGDFGGQVRQFGVKGNAPDPATVSESTGLVKYGLTKIMRPSSAAPFDHSPDEELGVLLVEVLPNDKLKVESFPGETLDDVTGFSAAAVIYER